MPTETIENKSGAPSIDAPASGGTDPMVDRGATGARTEAGSKPASNQRITRRGKLLIGVLGAAVIAAAVFGIPWIRFVLSTVSTDDAFVNGHVTFVAPRVHGRSPGFWWMTTIACTREIFLLNWTRSHFGTQSP